MLRFKVVAILAFALLSFAACWERVSKRYIIADNKTYESSLFRQHCAVCHGSEGDGKTLDDATIVPSLREGEFKMKTETEIYKQISEGGNGMSPFRNQLSEKELRMMTDFVYKDLRGQ